MHCFWRAENLFLRDEVMEQLEISRGNANMNLRALIDWGIVKKEFVKGDRKEYFVAEKMYGICSSKLPKKEEKREIEPVISFLKS